MVPSVPAVSNPSRAPSTTPAASSGNRVSITMTAPAVNGTEQAAQESAASKNMTAAAKKFKEIAATVGPDQVKTFFELYGTEGIKPEAKKEQPLFKAKNVELDSKIKDDRDKRLGLPTRPDGFGANFTADPNWDIKTPDKLSVASALTAAEWQEIIETSKLLHGYVMTATGVSRARFQAFQFKPKLKTPTDRLTDRRDLIPECEVFDSSSISIKETNSRIESSMAQNGFSSEAISASLSVSTLFAGGSASSSFATEQQRSQSSSNFADRKEYTATYSFPRARVFLDELNLEVTPECAAYLAKIRDAAAKITNNLNKGLDADTDYAVTKALVLVRQFNLLFGHIFTRTVLLGGQLISTKSAASLGGQSEELKRDAMQVAAAVSFDSKWVSGSASFSKGKSDELQTRSLNLDSSSALAWSACGGNTLLCANPAAWANSVAHYSTWRVIEQYNVQYIPKLISNLRKQINEDEKVWSTMEDVFLTISQNAFNAIPPILPGTWTGKLYFKTLDEKYLVLINDVLSVSDSERTIFQVLDADDGQLGKTIPTLPQLFADHPLFLVPSDIELFRLGRGDGFPGLWVDPSSNDGTIRANASNFSRWSLRSAASLQAPDTAISSDFNPNHEVLHNGDEVGLFNHSYWSGGAYRDITNPPLFAPYAFKKYEEQTIRVWKMEPPPGKGFVDDIPENRRIALFNRYPNWEFLKAENMISGLLVRVDRGQFSRTMTPGSDRMQMQNLRNYYVADFLELNAHNPNYIDHQNVDEAAMRQYLSERLWYNSRGSRGKNGRLTENDYNCGMNEYKKNMKIQSLEPLRLKIYFV